MSTTVVAYPTSLGSPNVMSGTAGVLKDSVGDDPSDDVEASASLAKAFGSGTTKAYWGDFGFDDTVPAGASIETVEVSLRAKMTVATNGANTAGIRLSGTTETTVGVEPAANSTTFVTDQETMARPGGGTWSRADLLDGVFEVFSRLQVGTGGAARTFTHDWVRVTVTWDLAQVTAGPAVRERAVGGVELVVSGSATLQTGSANRGRAGGGVAAAASGSGLLQAGSADRGRAAGGLQVDVRLPIFAEARTGVDRPAGPDRSSMT